jgi:tetratricopeptide (TPR) repeat protein
MPRYATPYEYSVAEYEELARLNPANTDILYNLAWKYFEEGRYAEALAGFQRVLALNPKDEDAQYNQMIVRLYSEIVLPNLGPADTSA